MRILLQRVSEAFVRINQKEARRIGSGLVVLVSVEPGDTQDDLDWLCRKILNLRIFDDEDKRMNRSVMDVDGELLVISQFTLHASTKKGNRPSWVGAAPPDQARPLFDKFVVQLQKKWGGGVKTGEFGAYMEVGLVNDGPVTIWIDSKRRE